MVSSKRCRMKLVNSMQTNSTLFPVSAGRDVALQHNGVLLKYTVHAYTVCFAR